MQKKAGNSCLYCLYNTFNLIFLLQSLLVVAMGGWLWYEVKKAGPFNLSFIILGSFEFLLSIIGQNAKYSKGKLNCYLIFMMLLFIAQSCIASIGIASKDKIIDWAAERANSKEEAQTIKDLIKKNVYVSLYIVLSVLSIQILCMLTVYMYKKSFVERNATEDPLIDRSISLPTINTTYQREIKDQDNKFKD